LYSIVLYICLDSVRFHYTLLDVCAEFLFVYINKQHVFVQKTYFVFVLTWEGGSHHLYDADGPDDGPVYCLP